MHKLNTVVEHVRSLWIPLEDINLLVPNVAVAEVINYQPLNTIQDGPDWLLGRLHWRDQDLPVISLEAMCGLTPPQGQRSSRLSIVNNVLPDSSVSFYAIVTAGIPRLFSADIDSLGESILDQNEFPQAVADCIEIAGDKLLIPNLEHIQQLVEDAWGKASSD